MLTHRKNISVRILEPSNLVAGERGPNSKFAILNERVYFERDSSFFKPGDYRLDV